MDNRSSSQSLSAVYRAARIGDDTRLQFLISQEPDDNRRRLLIEWSDVKGRTPLIIAAQKGHLECVLKLLHHSADIHHMSKRDFGGTALHEAVYYKWRSNGIVEALLRHGAHPFVKNAHNRTVLQLALIENAAKDLYVPWLIMFDRYGYFAEEVMVREFTGEETVWRCRWVTIVPLYATSDPRSMRCLRKTMVIYSDYLTRTLLSSINLYGARAAEQTMITFVKLDASQCQPSGLAASRVDSGSWVIAFKATNVNQTSRLDRFITAINEETETIIEQHLNRGQHPNVGEQGAEGIPANAITQYPREPRLSTIGHDGQNVSTNVSTAQSSSTVPAVNIQSDGRNIDDGVCVICLDKRQNAGFVHGDSRHVCACSSCAYLVYLSDRSRCPICRRPIDSIAEYNAYEDDSTEL